MKPTKIKKLQGTLKPSREMKNEMMPPQVEEVETPTALANDYAEKEWLKQTRILTGLGMLHETDTSILLAYCNEMGKYFECVDVIKEGGLTFNTPNGHIMPRPEASEGNKALANAIKISNMFGFNPTARTKIEMPDKKPNDPFSEL